LVQRDMFILKVSHGTDLRRVAFASLPSYEILSGMVQNMFAFDGQPKITYVDDEGDNIVIKTDLELNEAFRLCKKEEPSVLRLYATGVILDQIEPLETHEEVDSQQGVPQPSSGAPAPQASVQDLVVLNDLQKQFDHVLSVVTEFFADDVQQRFTECKGLFENVIRSCDEQFKLASTKCQEQFQTIKTIVADLQSFNFEDQIKRLKDEIVRLTSQLHTRLILSASQATAAFSSSQVVPAAVPVESTATVSSSIVEVPVVAVVPPVAAPSALPPDAAIRDFSLLEGMGFLNRRKNLELLAKHKGDVVAVVEDLLAEEQ